MSQSELLNSEELNSDKNKLEVSEKSKFFGLDWFPFSNSGWFLSKDDKDPIRGRDTWFGVVLGAVKETATKILFRRIGFEDVQIVIAKNHETKEKYYKLRERLYRKKLGFKDYDGHENSYDKTGDVIIALYKGEVVAGGRLDLSSKHNDMMYNDNPELNGFTYKDLTKKIDPNCKEGDIYAEVCGLVIHERANADFFEKFFLVILTHAKNMNVSYFGGIAYPHLFLMYESIAQNLHLNLKIFKDLKFIIRGSYGQSGKHLEFFPLITILKGSNF